ncbi:MAG: LPS translocon maturation chaperone LptM [Pseudomonadota bacterium]
MRTSLTTFVLAGVVLLLSACGQKGDLYISDTLAQKEGVAEKAERMPTIHGRPLSGSPAASPDLFPTNR